MKTKRVWFYLNFIDNLITTPRPNTRRSAQNTSAAYDKPGFSYSVMVMSRHGHAKCALPNLHPPVTPLIGSRLLTGGRCVPPPLRKCFWGHSRTGTVCSKNHLAVGPTLWCFLSVLPTTALLSPAVPLI